MVELFTEWQDLEEILQNLEDKEDIRDAEAAMKRIKKDGGIPFKQLKKK